MKKGFDSAFFKTMQYEGLYCNNPKDTGGETYKGIARNFWPNWPGWKMIDVLKLDKKSFPKNLTLNTVLNDLIQKFYYDNFWVVIGGNDLFNDEVAKIIFDTAVNNGVVTAIKLVQETLDLPRSGKLDKITMDKLNTIR
jgi:lysozyme family protein